MMGSGKLTKHVNRSLAETKQLIISQPRPQQGSGRRQSVVMPRHSSSKRERGDGSRPISKTFEKVSTYQGRGDKPISGAQDMQDVTTRDEAQRDKARRQDDGDDGAREYGCRPSLPHD